MEKFGDVVAGLLAGGILGVATSFGLLFLVVAMLNLFGVDVSFIDPHELPWSEWVTGWSVGFAVWAYKDSSFLQ